MRKSSPNPKTLHEELTECRTAEHSKTQTNEMHANKLSALGGISSGNSRDESSRSIQKAKININANCEAVVNREPLSDGF